MIPGIPEFLLSGGAGGLTVSPSSGSYNGPVSNSLNFGSYGSGAGGGAMAGVVSSPNLLIVGAVVLAAIYLMGRK